MVVVNFIDSSVGIEVDSHATPCHSIVDPLGTIAGLIRGRRVAKNGRHLVGGHSLTKLSDSAQGCTMSVAKPKKPPNRQYRNDGHYQNRVEQFKEPAAHR